MKGREVGDSLNKRGNNYLVPQLIVCRSEGTSACGLSVHGHSDLDVLNDLTEQAARTNNLLKVSAGLKCSFSH